MCSVILERRDQYAIKHTNLYHISYVIQKCVGKMLFFIQLTEYIQLNTLNLLSNNDYINLASSSICTVIKILILIYKKIYINVV